jgi:hypothetical protein
MMENSDDIGLREDMKKKWKKIPFVDRDSILSQLKKINVGNLNDCEFLGCQSRAALSTKHIIFQYTVTIFSSKNI